MLAFTMDMPSYGDGQAIVALATPRSAAALAIVRCSGPGCIGLAAQAFSRPDSLLQAPGHTLVHGWLLNADGGKIDEVMAAVYRAPRSFTGEDAVEFTCHGGLALIDAALAALRGVGFREALPGEFSFRAFMNGKLDLPRAESVMELVQARTELARSHAVRRLSGELSRELAGLRDRIARVLAACELFLDYSEDDGVSLSAGGGSDAPERRDLEAEGRLPERAEAEALHARLKALAASFAAERLYGEGATVAVAGRPNAGKSSLFNRLLREERSIVSDTAGTTRDWIESWVNLQGMPLRLVDTAGLRESGDEVERAGVERSRSLLDGADLILYLVDGTGGLTREDEAFLAEHAGPRLIPLWTKSDKAILPQPEGFLTLSSRSGDGIAELAERMERVLRELSGASPEASIGKASATVGIATKRQKELVDQAERALAEALRLDASGLPLDLAAPCLREALDAIGELTGEVSRADILELMFSRFCIGK